MCVGLYPPQTPSRRRKSAFPPYRSLLCRSHPLRGSKPQRFLISSIYIPRRKSQRGIQPVLYPVCWFTVSALMSWVPAMRNCVSNGVRTSRCRADFFRLSKSRCGLPSRRAPDRLAALLTAFRLIYRILPTPGFHRWERPSLCPQPDLNRHTKALAIELQGHVRLTVCTVVVIVCEGYRARSHRQVATLPSGTAHRSCTFATSCAAPLPNTCLNLVWITSQCFVGYAAYKIAPHSE